MSAAQARRERHHYGKPPGRTGRHLYRQGIRPETRAGSTSEVRHIQGSTLLLPALLLLGRRQRAGGRWMATVPSRYTANVEQQRLMKTHRKLIEVALPLESINKAAAREKSIRHGHPSTLHLWWARRPLAAARAVIFGQMVDDPSSLPELFPTEEAQQQERE